MVKKISNKKNLLNKAKLFTLSAATMAGTILGGASCSSAPGGEPIPQEPPVELKPYTVEFDRNFNPDYSKLGDISKGSGINFVPVGSFEGIGATYDVPYGELLVKLNKMMSESPSHTNSLDCSTNVFKGMPAASLSKYNAASESSDSLTLTQRGAKFEHDVRIAFNPDNMTDVRAPYTRIQNFDKNISVRNIILDISLPFARADDGYPIYTMDFKNVDAKQLFSDINGAFEQSPKVKAGKQKISGLDRTSYEKQFGDDYYSEMYSYISDNNYSKSDSLGFDKFPMIPAGEYQPYDWDSGSRPDGYAAAKMRNKQIQLEKPIRVNAVRKTFADIDRTWEYLDIEGITKTVNIGSFYWMEFDKIVKKWNYPEHKSLVDSVEISTYVFLERFARGGPVSKPIDPEGIVRFDLYHNPLERGELYINLLKEEEEVVAKMAEYKNNQYGR